MNNTRKQGKNEKGRKEILKKNKRRKKYFERK
jgi:hypothetical protein